MDGRIWRLDAPEDPADTFQVDGKSGTLSNCFILEIRYVHIP